MKETNKDFTCKILAEIKIAELMENNLKIK
ncbi:hypothetical protein QFZ72_002264 [Bacillus sp. V2I10]|nr:hypothetical protein [Bacillus sp. V2I10]